MSLNYTIEEIENYLTRLKKLSLNSKTKLVYQKNKDKNYAFAYLYNIDKEKEYLDAIIEDFGCYSGTMLKEMTRLTTSWLETREGLNEGYSSERIIDEKDIKEYFSKVYNEYKMSFISDISKYSTHLFKEAKKDYFNNRLYCINFVF